MDAPEALIWDSTKVYLFSRAAGSPVVVVFKRIMLFNIPAVILAYFIFLFLVLLGLFGSLSLYHCFIFLTAEEPTPTALDADFTPILPRATATIVFGSGMVIDTTPNISVAKFNTSCVSLIIFLFLRFLFTVSSSV